jgi:beta-xylosidase
MRLSYWIIVALSALTLVGAAHAQDTPGMVSRSGITYKQAAKPLYIDPVFNGSTDPMVCYNRQTQRWYMYYTSRRSNVPGLNGIESIHGSPIGVAASDDGGATWTYIGNCTIDYHPDKDPTYWAPEVIEYQGVYHMYLTYVPGIFTDWEHPREIVHLTSKDGMDWKTQSVLPLVTRKVIDACVIQLSGGTWRLWYNNESDNKSIYYAESPDLYHWTDKGKVDISTVGEGPNVIYWHDTYFMIVDEWKGLSVFSSKDALNWKKQEQYLVAGVPASSVTGNETSQTAPSRVRMLDGTRGNHADIEVVNGRAYMFYFSGIPSSMQMRGSAVYVQELVYHEDGTVTCDPLAPCYINLGRK